MASLLPFFPTYWLIHFDLVPSRCIIMSYLLREINYGRSTPIKESCLLIYYSVQINEFQGKVEVVYVVHFIFVLPSLAIVAEERKSRGYNSTRNHSVVYRTMITILLSFLKLLLIFIENLCLGTKVWSLFPCLKKLDSTTCSYHSPSALHHIPFSPPPPASSSPLSSFFPNTARSIKMQWKTFDLEGKCQAEEIPIECTVH